MYNVSPKLKFRKFTDTGLKLNLSQDRSSFAIGDTPITYISRTCVTLIAHIRLEAFIVLESPTFFLARAYFVIDFTTNADDITLPIVATCSVTGNNLSINTDRI